MMLRRMRRIVRMGVVREEWLLRIRRQAWVATALRSIAVGR